MNRLEILSPKIDFVFKRIFGNEKHPKILISFLNSVMTNSDPIESVEILNTDIEKEAEREQVEGRFPDPHQKPHRA